MGFSRLSPGVAGALEAGAIALLIGALLRALCHHLGRRVGWKQGTEIGVAFVATLFIAAGVDAWDLFSPQHHPARIAVRDRADARRDLRPGVPRYTRVFELGGAVAGVMIGWYLAAVVPSGKRRARD